MDRAVLATVLAALSAAMAPGQKATSARDLYYESTEAAPAQSLGLKLEIRRNVDGQWRMWDPAAVFRSGDRIQVRLTANRDGYLYVAAHGSDGSWTLLYPARSGQRQSERQLAGSVATVQAEFDDKAGDEWLYVFLLREPEADWKKLTATLPPDGTIPVPLAQLVNPTSDRNLIADREGAGAAPALFVVSRGTQLVTRLRLRHE